MYLRQLREGGRLKMYLRKLREWGRLNLYLRQLREGGRLNITHHITNSLLKLKEKNVYI